MALESSPPLVVNQYQGCVDVRGQSIPHGLLFAPGPDECLVCTCFNGTPGLCRTMFCAPPSNCKSIRMGDGCCEWICLEKYPDDHRGGGGGEDDGVVAADVNLRLVASAVTAICSVALLFFLIYRLRKKKRQRRNGNSHDDAMSLDSQMPPPPHSLGPNARDVYPMTAMPPPPPPAPPSARSYWLTWWKPSSNNEDAFDARPAPPPSYDAAMMHVTDSRRAPNRGGDFDYDYEAEGMGARYPATADDDDDDSVSGISQAPPYNQIHHDPIIPDWVNPVTAATSMPLGATQPISLPPQGTGASFAASGLPETSRDRRQHVTPRAGAALVLPVRPPVFGALSGAGTAAFRRPRSQIESRQAEVRGGDGGRGHRQSSSSSGRRPLHSTLPSGVLMNLNARSREGIVVPPSLPPRERDAALQRFSLQLQLNISDSSDSSNSAFAVADTARDEDSPASSSSISSSEHQ